MPAYLRLNPIKEWSQNFAVCICCFKLWAMYSTKKKKKIVSNVGTWESLVSLTLVPFFFFFFFHYLQGIFWNGKIFFLWFGVAYVPDQPWKYFSGTIIFHLLKSSIKAKIMHTDSCIMMGPFDPCRNQHVARQDLSRSTFHPIQRRSKKIVVEDKIHFID